MTTAQSLLFGYYTFEQLLFGAVAVCGLIGSALVAATREDTFQAANRQTKWIWMAILAGSAFAVITRMPFLSWAGMVAIGVYWFDVRPHLKSILDGSAWL